MKTETIEIVTTWRITYETPDERDRAIREALKGVEATTYTKDGIFSAKPLKKSRILKP